MTRSGLIIISRDWLREEIRKVIHAWSAMNPGALEQVKRDVAEFRDRQMRPNATSDSGDLSVSARIPKDILLMLAWDPGEVNPATGEPLGVGIGVDHVREHEHDITDLLLEELPICKVSNLHGAPKARGWA